MGPASYRDIIVGPGGLLQLSGGTYSARSIAVGRRGRIVCTEACDISVAGGVVLRREAQLGAAQPLRADQVRLNVAGSGIAPGFEARARTVVAATVYAPGADIALGRDGSFRGAYVGRRVTVGAGARVRGDSAL
jgi:hypothetical protein